MQSRYYNPEWGRFINADSIAAATGELLSGNMFAYCKNNPVNMSDQDGDRPEFSGTGHDTGEDNAVSLAIMNHRYNYDTGMISKPVVHTSSSSFNVKASVTKNTFSAALDRAGQLAGSTLASGAKKYVSSGILTIGKYVTKPTVVDRLVGKGMGFVGTAFFTGHDLVADYQKHQNYAMLVDCLSAGAGILAGIGLGVLGGIAVTAGAPVVLIGVLGFGISVGISVLIDNYATYKKEQHYGR